MPSLVTVVVPTYGHEAYVLDTLASVFAQDYPAVEVIVVDDGSPDRTEAVLAPLAREERIRYVRQANAGAAAARNAGAALARGELLLFLDDDDLLYHGALACLASALDAHPELAFISGRRIAFADAPGSTAPTTPPAPSDAEGADVVRYDRLAFLVANQITSPGQVLMRRAAFEAVGGFDRELWGTDDWDLWLRLLARHLGGMCARPTLAYRLHAANASRQGGRMRQNARAVVRRHVKPLPAELRTPLKALIARHQREYLAGPAAQALRGALARRDWPAAARSAALQLHLAADVSYARLCLKSHLMASGYWRMPAEHPLAARFGAARPRGSGPRQIVN